MDDECVACGAANARNECLCEECEVQNFCEECYDEHLEAIDEHYSG